MNDHIVEITSANGDVETVGALSLEDAESLVESSKIWTQERACKEWNVPMVTKIVLDGVEQSHVLHLED